MTDETLDRRKDDTAVIGLITEMHKDLRDLSVKLSTHMTDETKELAAEVAKLMAAAFPDGDPVTHKKRHELEIKQAEKRAAFWADLSASVAKWGLAGFLGWVVWSLWKALLLGPKP